MIIAKKQQNLFQRLIDRFGILAKKKRQIYKKKNMNYFMDFIKRKNMLDSMQ